MIRLNGVSRFYPARAGAAGGTIRALDDFTLRVEPGEWIAVMGPSGSGKSTLVNLIGCLDSPSTGEIWLDNENVAHLGTKDLTRVRAEKIGITGYCMGGRLAMYAAGHYGDRVAAAAAYHPAGLATDSPDSPHRLADGMKATIYVGAAMEDQSFDAAQQARFDEALTDAGVTHTIEQYHARHGFVPPDTPTYDPAAAKRHDETLFALFAKTLS